MAQTSVTVSRRAFLGLASLVLAGCASPRSVAGDGAVGASDTPAKELGTLIPHRFADAQEGSKLIVSHEAYNRSLTQEGLDYRMQKKGATLDEWKAFAAEQTLDFDEETMAGIDAALAYLTQRTVELNVTLPATDEITFVCTTGFEESDAPGYTHGTEIYLEDSCARLVAGATHTLETETDAQAISDALLYLSVLAHELFHCLTRTHPDFRRAMYAIIGFDVADEDFEFGPEVTSRIYSNPDVEHHDSSAVFTIDGRKRRCATVLYVEKPFEQEGDDFWDVNRAGLVPIDDLDTLIDHEEASDFFEVFGNNTDYVIDPEECMADNFSFALVYGLDGIDGEPYKDPQIIEAILEAMRA